MTRPDSIDREEQGLSAAGVVLMLLVTGWIVWANLAEWSIV